MSAQQTPNPAHGDDGRPPERQPPSPRWQEFIIWVLVPLVLMVWNILAFWPQTHPEVPLPYSAFLDQARSDNIAKVHIAGDEITGSFVKPIRWSEPKQDQSATVPAKGAPAKTLADPRSGPNIYAEFQTTFPVAVGDPQLLATLEAHKVIVEVSHPSTPWAIELLANWGPMLLPIGFFAWMGAKVEEFRYGCRSHDRGSSEKSIAP